MIFRFVSDDDWHSLFQEKREGALNTSSNCALSSGFVRRCASGDPRPFIHSIKIVDRRLQKLSGSDVISKAATNGK